uniref:Ribonuclease H-like domain-containing protein n=1 Tax=Tanacetum cinerariifolium TaxID=118510 RepID=A0A699GGI8_TANCI|nr:ribonuclease H-like domain-containing protein [Tanacetum cinerariifolium]
MTETRQGLSFAAIEQLINQRVADAMEAYKENQRNGNANQNEAGGNAGGVQLTTRGCSYKAMVPDDEEKIKRQEAGRVYVAGTGNKTDYAGTLPHCDKCKFHHYGPCPVKCGNCKKVGHQARDCWTPNSVTCYGCGEEGHTKRYFPGMKNQYGDEEALQNLDIFMGLKEVGYGIRLILVVVCCWTLYWEKLDSLASKKSRRIHNGCKVSTLPHQNANGYAFSRIALQWLQIILISFTKERLRMYNNLVERCFTDCADSFRRKTFDKQEESCVKRCAEKFLKHLMRVGLSGIRAKRIKQYNNSCFNHQESAMDAEFEDERKKKRKEAADSEQKEKKEEADMATLFCRIYAKTEDPHEDIGKLDGDKAMISHNDDQEMIKHMQQTNKSHEDLSGDGGTNPVGIVIGSLVVDLDLSRLATILNRLERSIQKDPQVVSEPEAIKSRFGGNDESKKMQKYILKQQFEGFFVSNSEGLHKGYDMFQNLLSQLEIHGACVSTEDADQKFLRSLPSSWSQVSLNMRSKPGVDNLSFDYLYNNLKVFESDVKGSTASSSSTQNVKFVSSDSTNSCNEVSTAYGVSTSSGHNSHKEGTLSYTDDLMYSFFTNQSSGSQLDHEDLEHADEFDLEKMDLKWQDEHKAMVTIDGEGVDWSGHVEDDTEDYALMAFNSSNSGSNTEMSAKDKARLGRSSDVEDSHVNDKFVEVEGMHAVPHLMTGNYMPSKSDFRIDESKFTYGPKQSKTSEFDANTSDLDSYESSFSVETLESAILTKTSRFPVNAARHNFSSQAALTSTVRQVNTGRPILKEIRPRHNVYKSHSPIRRPFNRTTAPKANFANHKVNTVRDTSVSVVGGNGETVAKASTDSSQRWLGSLRETNFSSLHVQDNPHQTLKGKVIVDSGCSRHMTGNKAYLVDYQDFNGGPVALENKVLFTDTECLVLSPDFNLPDENQVLLRVHRQNNMYSFNLENIVPSGGLACLIAKDTVDKSNKWHMRITTPVLLVIKGSNTRPPTEAVSTACYVLNKVLVTKPQNKTPYELLTGFLVGNSLSIKAFRVYNLETKRVKENLHINVLENKPTWLFDLDYLPDSMNYQPITVENKANKTAGPKEANNSVGTQDSFDAGNSKMEAEHAPEYYILPLWYSYTLSIKSSKVKNGYEKLNGDTGTKTNEEPVDQEDQAFLEELERLKRQEQESNDAAENLRKTFAQSTEDLLLQEGADRASSTTMDEIFTSASYDDEGTMADFINLESIVNVSPIPQSRIYSLYPTTQILRDPNSAVQTRSKVNKSLGARAFIQKRTHRQDYVFKKDKKDIMLQKEDGIFISQDKYVAKILKKFDLISVKTTSTLIKTKKPLVKDEEAAAVDVHLYRSMIGSLMNLTASRPDIIELAFDLEAYSDSDYAGANLDRKSTTGGYQFLGGRLISWQCKKQTIVASLTTKAEYVDAASCCKTFIHLGFSKNSSLGKEHVSKQGRKKAKTGSNIKEEGVSTAGETLSAATLAVSTVSVQKASISTAKIIFLLDVKRMKEAATAAIVFAVCQANDHGFGGLGGFSVLGTKPSLLIGFQNHTLMLLLAAFIAIVATHRKSALGVGEVKVSVFSEMGNTAEVTT